MRLGDAPESGNVEYDSGRGGGGGLGGMGGGLFGLLFQIVASRFGIVGMIVLALGYCALTSMGGLGGIGGGGSTTASTAPNGGGIKVDPVRDKFAREVLGSTEQVWGDVFKQSGAQYTPTTLHFYSNAGQSGCGTAQSAMGPFYCPTDKKIYLDAAFFDELTRRFQAPGDFAQAYVIAHEVGHHVQDLQGTLDRTGAAQARASTAGGNAIQVGVELQADCYAGVWAKRSGRLEAGDIEEGMRAAQAIGDDQLTQGRVSPDNFTHGTSAQRMQALQTGLQTGDPAQCKYTR